MADISLIISCENWQQEGQRWWFVALGYLLLQEKENMSFVFFNSREKTAKDFNQMAKEREREHLDSAYINESVQL